MKFYHLQSQLGYSFADKDHVIWWTAPEKLQNGSANCCFQGHELSLIFSDFGRLNYPESDLFHVIQSCSSCPPPTDGTLCHSWDLTHTTDLCSHQDPQVSFQTQTVRYFIPSLYGSLRSARMHHTTSQKCAGRSLSLTILGAFNGIIVMDSVSSWFIDHCPQLSCEYSNSYQSLPEITFPCSLSFPKL